LHVRRGGNASGGAGGGDGGDGVVKRMVVVEKNVLAAFANNFRGEIAARRSDKRRKC